MIDRLTLTTKFNGDFNTQNTTFDVVKMTRSHKRSGKNTIPARLVMLPESYMITADRTMIEIVISSLIDNALKCSDETVRVMPENDALHVQRHWRGHPKRTLKK